jgi:hypothetical protein
MTTAPATLADRDVGRALAGATVLDEAERPVRLGSFWTERPAVLAFLRHFG